MSEGLLDVDAAARFVGITPKELQKLASNGEIQRQNGKFHPVALVRGFVEHIRNDAKRKYEQPTQVEIARHLDMSERNLRELLRKLGIDHTTTTLDKIRTAYIQDLREKAAGRGGDDQANLTKQRAGESAVNTALKRLDYHERLGSLIHAEDAALVITDWCSTANREYRSGIAKLIGEIQSVLKVEVPNELVENIVSPTVKRIQDHAGRLGRDLVEGGDDVHTAKDDTDSGVAV